MEKLLEILAELHPESDLSSRTDLADSGLLDSFDIISLVNDLSEAFGVDIGVEYIEPENFNSADAIAALLRELGAEI
ncbi:MAG: phosphopantetheine-binding protein [Oscillospiraceae bacterium]|nr:phosphopantetheine-binding protein [Oscillospiraceae bacterium]